MTIRPYEESDEAGVAALWREVFPDAPLWNHPETDIHRKLTVQRELFFVAKAQPESASESEIIGTAMGGFDGHRGWVYYVAVNPRLRRKGIGKALMERVERGLIEIGCPKLNLQVRADNHTVISFYRRLGYNVEERASLSKRLE
ncbi:MAG: GNAT family acetyltransferase [Candidatus Eisenbacteria bacterium]|uniref:GNAT family acetyltransferase n=1 Tax=Eiseniibacteriota bacterium TaxID=2212470 RepID=A0A948RWC6_UNCEI|nr:GNAT family acetyltransferase [Candidatus Eisenbacteria bacterium]MBU2692070.1 GNAT family acetyltransferase [Candidatus Eisenbacteria bacterium]